MKWLLLLFSFVKPMLGFSDEKPIINPIEDLKNMIRENAVKVMVLYSAFTALAIVFASGIVITFLNIGAQYDQNGIVILSSVVIVGILMIAVSLIVAGILLKAYGRDDNPTPGRSLMRREPRPSDHPLQDALAVLILDFVKEREKRREITNMYLANQEYQQRASHSSHSTNENYIN